MNSSQVVFLIVPREEVELLPYPCLFIGITVWVFAHCQNSNRSPTAADNLEACKENRCSAALWNSVNLLFVVLAGQRRTERRRRRRVRTSLSPAPYGNAGGPARRDAPLGSPSGPKMWGTFPATCREVQKVINVPLWSFLKRKLFFFTSRGMKMTLTSSLTLRRAAPKESHR